MKEKTQEIYINLDDSGKLTSSETVCVYGGLVFFSKHEKDKFITQYRSIINEIKCSYCGIKNCSRNKCPEIKNTNIKPSHKRRLINYIKKYYLITLVIENERVYDHIKLDKAARGRFLDYCLRRMIKDIIKDLIEKNKIKPNNNIRLIINIDEQTTKSNGYYNLKEGLEEELKYGILNFNYGTAITPIIRGNLEIVLSYQNSINSYVVQASDLLAGTMRKKYLENSPIIKEILKNNFLIILP